MSKRKSNKRVYARIVSLQRLIWWQFISIMISISITLAFNWYHHEMTMMKLEGFTSKTIVGVKVCNEIGYKDCLKVRAIIKEHNK